MKALMHVDICLRRLCAHIFASAKHSSSSSDPGAGFGFETRASINNCGPHNQLPRRERNHLALRICDALYAYGQLGCNVPRHGVLTIPILTLLGATFSRSAATAPVKDGQPISL